MKLKHTLLALGAAAALGAAGSAHAIAFQGYYDDTPAGNKATGLEVRENGAGHALVLPYFNAQGNTKTDLNITNDDHSHGKAVRVHVRGAANGDILKSFTVLLAPYETWPLSIEPNGGAAPRISSSHPACVFTDGNGTRGRLNEPLSLDNLAPYISQSAKVRHAGEGYIEFITMADIKASATLDNIKSRDCGALNELVRAFPTDDAEPDAKAAGLTPPQGRLSGLWFVINQDNWTAYSGRMTAIRATGNTDYALAYINFFPQRSAAEIAAGSENEKLAWEWFFAGVEEEHGGIYGGIRAGGWSAVPNLAAMQLVDWVGTEKQISAIGKALNRSNEYENDFVSDPTGVVPMLTDWVMSNPLQRYYAYVDYGKSAAEAKVVEADYSGYERYDMKGSLKDTKDMGPMLCGSADMAFRSREGKASTDSRFEFCGATWTVGFASKSVMDASVGRVVHTPPFAAGWARVDTYGYNNAALLGFGAFSAKNEASGISYPSTWPHKH